MGTCEIRVKYNSNIITVHVIKRITECTRQANLIIYEFSIEKINHSTEKSWGLAS